jgi:hypothetical protein
VSEADVDRIYTGQPQSRLPGDVGSSQGNAHYNEGGAIVNTSSIDSVRSTVPTAISPGVNACHTTNVSLIELAGGHNECPGAGMPFVGYAVGRAGDT